MMRDIMDRVLADARDRPAWLKARARAIGGSDAAGFAKLESAPLYLRAKLHNRFMGNAYTVHGNDREAAALAAFNIPQNTLLFRSEANPRHVATPDGYWWGVQDAPEIAGELAEAELLLAQCKTSTKPLPTKIPPTYLRQIWWEQYVMGAERTLLVWEHHQNFHPMDMEPVSAWVYRDDAAIAKLIQIADYVLEGMDAALAFAEEMKEIN